MGYKQGGLTTSYDGSGVEGTVFGAGCEVTGSNVDVRGG